MIRILIIASATVSEHNSILYIAIFLLKHFKIIEFHLVPYQIKFPQMAYLHAVFGFIGESDFRLLEDDATSSSISSSSMSLLVVKSFVCFEALNRILKKHTKLGNPCY